MGWLRSAWTVAVGISIQVNTLKKLTSDIDELKKQVAENEVSLKEAGYTQSPLDLKRGAQSNPGVMKKKPVSC